MIVYQQVSTLSHDLGIPVRTLYAVSNDIARHYHTVVLPKRDGGCRCLSVPDETLKRIQRAITRQLLVYMPVSPCATAYRFGGSIFRNAAPHTGKEKILRMDIRHFFDSILYSTVKETVFPPEIFSEPLRVLLTLLCYHRDALPQGAPSSPAISNIILRDFDETVWAWCRERNLDYTRYCDDMTVSGEFDEQSLLAFVRGELRARGLFLNEQKTRLARAGQCQRVTGLTVNEKVSVPAEYRRQVRQALYYTRKFGVEDHLRAIGSEEPPARYLACLLGRVNHVLAASPGDTACLRGRAWLTEQLRARHREWAQAGDAMSAPRFQRGGRG